MAGKVRSIQREIAKKAEREAQAALPNEITVTIGVLVDSVGTEDRLGALHVLCHQPTPNVSAAFVFKAGRLMREVEREIKEFEVARKSLCKTYGTLNTEKDIYEFEGDAQAEFDRQIEELRQAKVKLNVSPIRLPELEKANGMTGAVMMMLDWLIIEK